MPDAATAKPDQWLVPNQNTMPHEPGADPLKEPVRPQRDRQPIDRYEPTMLAAQYMAAANVGYSLTGHVPHPEDLYVELEGMAERFAGLASEACGDDDYAQRVQSDFSSLPAEAQRAACVMADYNAISSALGATSPQAVIARETYAAAVLDAAIILAGGLR